MFNTSRYSRKDVYGLYIKLITENQQAINRAYCLWIVSGQWELWRKVYVENSLNSVACYADDFSTM